MKSFLTIAAAGALVAVSFTTSAFAQPATTQQGMSAEEHQRMMSGGGTAGHDQMMSEPDTHLRMVAMMERCQKMMGKKDKHASASGRERARMTSAEGKWAWRPDPRQAPGPRAALRPPVRVWVPAEKSSTA